MDNYLKIIQQIKNRVLHPVYLLFGEEPYFIDIISKAVEESVLKEEEKEFNQIILYGQDTTVQQLIGIAKRYPMMSSHLVVIVREAQMIKEIENLQPYLDNPIPSTILVLCCKNKKFDKRKSFYKAAMKMGVAFESEKIKDFRLHAWIASYITERGYQIREKNSLLIAEHLGNDLGKVVNEMEKVFISLEKGKEVTSDIIEQSIGISKDYNMFEFQNALGSRNIQKAVRIVLHFVENPKENPFPKILAFLYSYFSKLLKIHFINTGDKQMLASELGINPFFVSEYQQAAKNFPLKKVIRIIEHLRYYDLKSKGVDNPSVSHGELLKELTFKILH